MCRPSPVLPFWRAVVKKGSKIRGRCSAGMPRPSSDTTSRILSAPISLATIRSVPPCPSSKACVAALTTRFVSTCPSAPG